MRLPLINAAGSKFSLIKSHRRCAGCGFLLAALLVISAGCASTPDQHTHFLRASEQVVSSGSYRVAPPDVIRIHCPIAPEIDGASQRIRPDGKIALRLLGEVQVAGLTTQELSDKIANLLDQYYVDPDVVVNVSGYRSQYYYIFGEVARPGPRPYSGRDTLIRALAEARPE
jgi:protein involved in polysaccharide export with SLBB domain